MGESVVPEAVEAQVTDAQKAEGAEAMRIAKLNHPDVDWQADPVTGAPLVPGHSAAETAETVTYNPPDPTIEIEGTEEAPAPEPTAKKADVKDSKEGK